MKKKLLSVLLTLALVVTAIGFIDTTSVLAATKTGATITASKCKISNKNNLKLTRPDPMLLNKYFDTASTTGKPVEYVSEVKNGAYLKITANEAGTLYIMGLSDGDYSSYTITGYTDKNLKNPAKAYNLRSDDVADELVIKPNDGKIAEYPMVANEVLYLAVSKKAALAIYYLPTSTIKTIDYTVVSSDTAYIQMGYDNFISNSKDYKLDTLYYMVSTTGFPSGYQTIRGAEFTKFKASKYNASTGFKIDIDKVLQVSDNSKVSLAGYFTYYTYDTISTTSSGTISGSYPMKHYCIIKIDDLHKYDEAWISKNAVSKPMTMVAGTNVIIGSVPEEQSSKKVCVQIGKKTYTTTPISYTLTLVDGGPIGSTGSDILGPASTAKKDNIYCIVLKSNLKTSDSVSMWYEGMEDAQMTYKPTSK